MPFAEMVRGIFCSFPTDNAMKGYFNPFLVLENGNGSVLEQLGCSIAALDCIYQEYEF